MNMKSIIILAMIMATAACQRHIYVSVSDSVSVPELFVDAYNRKDVEAMVGMVRDDVRYMFISGDQLFTEVAGKAKLATYLDGFFANSTPSTSEVLMHTRSGDFHQMIEKAHFQGKEGRAQSQCSAVAYQLKAEKILNIWYFDTHACPD